MVLCCLFGRSKFSQKFPGDKNAIKMSLKPASTMSSVFGSSLIVVDSGGKGRCLESTKNFQVGEELWTEKALLYSSFEDDIHPADCKPKWGSFYEEMASYLCSFEEVGSLDTARNLLQLVMINDKPGKVDAASLALLSDLTPSNWSTCTAAMEEFYQNFPSFPFKVTPSQLGMFLGILNNNQIELEEYGGSGLFPATAIMEHSCEPNCSFSTSGNMLTMCAIKEISIGDRLSIDYANGFYKPATLRSLDLMSTYGFKCTCPACTTGSVDFSRAFHCPQAKCTGVCYALVSEAPIFQMERDEGADDEEDDEENEEHISEFSACNVCSHVVCEDDRRRWCQLEASFTEPEEPLDSLEAVDKLRALGDDFHESHSILFWALTDISLDQAQSNPGEAYKASQETLRLLTSYTVVPAVHHERIMYLDRNGQLAIKVGEIKSAHEAFAAAHAASLLACGPNSPTTIKLENFRPCSLEELLAHYDKE